MKHDSQNALRGKSGGDMCRKLSGHQGREQRKRMLAATPAGSWHHHQTLSARTAFIGHLMATSPLTINNLLYECIVPGRTPVHPTTVHLRHEGKNTLSPHWLVVFVYWQRPPCRWDPGSVSEWKLPSREWRAKGTVDTHTHTLVWTWSAGQEASSRGQVDYVTERSVFTVTTWHCYRNLLSLLPQTFPSMSLSVLLNACTQLPALLSLQTLSSH